ncbi:MAG TPA: Uma2 family endonuclease, partial [Polyangiaceae bacterium]|nr:Uma2 family endonuclease [Polyangiaceae bacterium]
HPTKARYACASPTRTGFGLASTSAFATMRCVVGQPAQPYVSYADYLVGEDSSDLKHEWLAGTVYAMSRDTPEHARLSANVAATLRAQFKGECVVYSSDAMLFVRETQLSTYADASMTCGAVETHRVVKNDHALGEAITNPKVIVEVLSDRTEDYDRGESSATSCEWYR